MVVTMKLLGNKLSNIIENKYCILFVKKHLLKIVEEFCEVGILASRAHWVIFKKTKFNFWGGILFIYHFL